MRERLHDLIDGELSDETADALEAHLQGCAGCRAEREQLEALLAQAAALPRELEPGRDLWPGIASRLSAGARVLGFPDRPARGGGGSSRLALVAAAAALVAVSSSITALLMRDAAEPVVDDRARAWAVAVEADPLLEAERDYERAAAELMAALEERREQMAPQTREAVEQNLKIVDEALAELRSALERDPGNRQLARLFTTTQRKRVELLLGAVRLPQL